MATNSNFDVELHIEWKIKNSETPQLSRTFYFGNSRWHLETYLPRIESEIFACCVQLVNEHPLQEIETFRVKTYAKSEKKNLYFAQTMFSSPKSHKITIFKFCCTRDDAITVVSILGEGTGSTQNTEEVAGYTANVYVSSPSHSTSSTNDVSYLSESPLSTSEYPLISLESLSQDFSNMLEKNIMPDVQLRSGDCTLTAHKFLLSARSEVFRAMFEHKMAESNSGVVDIKDIDPPVLSVFLKYLYSGKVTEKLSDDMICELYSASDKYAVYSLSKLCSEFMAKCLREDNYLQILVLADAHSDEKLKKAVADFVLENNVLLKSENWITFSARHPILANEMYRAYVATSV